MAYRRFVRSKRRPFVVSSKAEGEWRSIGSSESPPGIKFCGNVSLIKPLATRAWVHFRNTLASNLKSLSSLLLFFSSTALNTCAIKSLFKVNSTASLVMVVLLVQYNSVLWFTNTGRVLNV